MKRCAYPSGYLSPCNFGSRWCSIDHHLLDALALDSETRIVFTGANADALEGDKLTHKIICASRSVGCHVASLGMRRYLSLMAISDVVVGNSSSGLLKHPSGVRALISVIGNEVVCVGRPS